VLHDRVSAPTHMDQLMLNNGMERGKARPKSDMDLPKRFGLKGVGDGVGIGESLN